MKYEELPPITRAEFDAALHRADGTQQQSAIIRLSLHDDDPAFIERSCNDLLDADDSGVRRAAIVAVGHLARLHGHVGPETQGRLRSLESDAELAGAVADTFDDIAAFTRP